MKRVMFTKAVLTIMLLASVGALTGCGDKKQSENKPETTTKQDVKNKVGEAYDATKTYTQEQMQAFMKQTEARLEEYEKELDKLQAKAKKLEGDAKANAAEQLKALRQKRDEAAKKLKDLSSSGGKAWEQLKSGIDGAMDDLGKSFKKASEEFNKP